MNLAIHVLKEGAVASEGWPRKQERGVVIIEEDEVPARMGNQENVLRKKGGGVAVRTLTSPQKRQLHRTLAVLAVGAQRVTVAKQTVKLRFSLPQDGELVIATKVKQEVRVV